MRNKSAGSILHFKMMLFHGLDTVQFSKSNYTHYSFVPQIPNVDYQDEVIFFTNDSNITNSFRKRYDELWVNTTLFQSYPHVTEDPLLPRYPELATIPIHPSMNFPGLAGHDFVARAVKRFDAETQRIDAIAFRITDNRISDAVLRAQKRGVPVRLLMDPDEYRDPDRLWHAKHVDKFWCSSPVPPCSPPGQRVEIKKRKHLGVLHQMSVVLPGLGEVIFGSSNWTIASAYQQDEHNYFYAPPTVQNPGDEKFWLFQWFASQFENKWNDTANYEPFQPLPPGKPVISSPANVSSGLSTTSVTLKWDGGNWGHLYDIYFGANPNPPLVAQNLQLGSPVTGTKESYTVTNLQPGTTYYWRIVGKTWAFLTNSGPVWSFTTAGAPPSGGGGTPATTPYRGHGGEHPGYRSSREFRRQRDKPRLLRHRRRASRRSVQADERRHWPHR